MLTSSNSYYSNSTSNYAMDCCNSTYHHQRYNNHPSSGFNHQHYQPAPHHHHYHPAAAAAGYYGAAAPPMGPAMAFDGPNMYHHHVADYYNGGHNHHAATNSADYAASYIGNAPFHNMTAASSAPHYHNISNGWSVIGGHQSSSSSHDYVYNPKEARIRKAIRDATREKIMGAGLAPANQQTRRPAQPWMLPDHDDQIMMSPGEPGGIGGGGALRAGMASPMCGTGFPMGPMYSTGAPMHHPHAAYMNNPLAQLQHQTDLWNPYHHKSQAKPPQDAAYLMSDHMQHPMSPYTSASSHVTQLHPPPISYSPSDSKLTSGGGAAAAEDLMMTTKPLHSGNQQLKAAKMEQPDSPPQDRPHLFGEHQRITDIDDAVQRTNAGGKVLVVVDGYENNSTAGDMMKMSTSITRNGFQQQEKIVLQNPFDTTASMITTPYYQQQQQHQRKKSLIPPPTSMCITNHKPGALDTSSMSSDIELRKHFILKYAQNYNYDHMELMLQQPVGGLANRAISYHYVTLPVTAPTSADKGQNGNNNYEISKELYVVQQGASAMGSGQVSQVGQQALNLSADLK